MIIIDLDDIVVLLYVIFVLDISDDFFDEIFDGYQSDANAVLVSTIAIVLESDFMECRRSFVF